MPTNNLLPQPTDFPEYTWRPATLADAEAFHRLSLANMIADGMESAQPTEEISHMISFFGDQLQENTLLALTEDGEIAAQSLLFMPPGGTEHRANLSGSVHVAHRGRGLGSFMLSWLEARARQHFAEFTDDLPCLMQSGIRDHQSDRVQLLTEHGFRPSRFYFKMERDLSLPIPECALIRELSLVNWSPERDAATMEAFNDSFRDHYGFFPVNEALWQAAFTGKPDFRGDLSQLAVAGDGRDPHGRVIGFCLCSVSPERNAQSGKNEGNLDDIGVIRGWRKQGVASALIVPALHALKAAGLELATLGVDTENPSGALRLYENLGFQSVQRAISFQKAVS